jgi:hypothetical protein
LRELARRARESIAPAEPPPRDRAPDLAAISTTAVVDPERELRDGTAAERARISEQTLESPAPAVEDEPRLARPTVQLSRAAIACAATFALGLATAFMITHWLAEARVPVAPAPPDAVLDPAPPGEPEAAFPPP